MTPGPIRRLAGNDTYKAVLADRRAVLRGPVHAFISPGSRFVWEVGSGHGHFLTAYAKAHPERTCVGIDLASDRVGRSLRKRDREQLGNLQFFHAEARLFLEVIPDNAQFSHVFILFPDPWPKLRHHKHRLLQSDFLTAIAPRAAPGCRLYFRTDHEPYFQEALAVVHGHTHWELASDPWPFEFRTVFQERAASHHSLVAARRP